MARSQVLGSATVGESVDRCAKGEHHQAGSRALMASKFPAVLLENPCDTQQAKAVGDVLLIMGSVSIVLSLFVQEWEKVLLSGAGAVLTSAGAALIIRDCHHK